MKQHKDCKFYYFADQASPKQGSCIAHPPTARSGRYINVLSTGVACGEFKPKEK